MFQPRRSKLLVGTKSASFNVQGCKIMSYHIELKKINDFDDIRTFVFKNISEITFVVTLFSIFSSFIICFKNRKYDY